METDKRLGKKWLALFLAVIMTVTLITPAIGIESVYGETEPAEQTEEQKPAKSEAADKKAAVQKTIEKQAEKIEIVKEPKDNTVVKGKNGNVSYDFEGLKIKVTYNDGSSQIMTCEFKDIFSYNEVEGIYIDFEFDFSKTTSGNSSMVITYFEYAEETDELLQEKTVELPVTCISPKTVDNLKVSLPEGRTAYIGLDEFKFYEDMQVTVTYKDGTSEVLECSSGDFDAPKHDPDGQIVIQAPEELKVGANTFTVQYGRDNDDWEFVVEASKDFMVQAEKIKFLKGMEITQMPQQQNAYIGTNGFANYSMKGLEVKVLYDDESWELVTVDRDENYDDMELETKYQPNGLRCQITVDETKLKEGSNNLQLTYTMADDLTRFGEEFLTFSKKMSVTGVKAKTVDSIQVVKGPSLQKILAGVDDKAIYSGVTVQITYTDQTSDFVVCETDGDFSLPSCLVGYHDMRIAETKLEVGENTIQVIYEDADERQKTASFTINAESYVVQDEELETDKNIGAAIDRYGSVILNANQELWLNHGDEEGRIDYKKYTGIKKAYSRVYLDTSGKGVVLDEKENIKKQYTNVKDCDANYLLLENGDLYSAYDNTKVASNVDSWTGYGWILKKDGSVQSLWDEKETLENLQNVTQIYENLFLTQTGILYTATYGEEAYEKQQIAMNIKKIVSADVVIGTDGKTYLVTSEYDGDTDRHIYELKAILDKEVVSYKAFYVYEEDAPKGDRECRLLTAQDYTISRCDLKTGEIKSLPGTFKQFTEQGYETTGGDFYDNDGNATTWIKKDEGFALNKNHVLYINDKELLKGVADFNPMYRERPSVIVRQDGTTWLFDRYEPTGRKRISPPQKLTQALMDSLYNDSQKWVSQLTITIPAQTYTGKALTPAVTVKDGDKLLSKNVDYTVSYSNNINAGTAKVTITGKGNYGGAVTKTFAIYKAAQTVSAQSFTKTYGNAAFSLGAKAQGKLTYKSGNPAVAAVSSTGVVTIKGAGKATITISAAATTNYNAATKNITITVAKAKQTITGASSFTKTYGSKPFSLGAKAKTKLTYKSSNTKVATVNSAGKVTLKGPGKATITITAAANGNYNAATKRVAITVKPKKPAAPKVKSTRSRTLKVSWKRDTKATGYQVIIAQNSKFKKGKKTATITKNKTTGKTFKKLKRKKTYYAKVRAYKKVGRTKLYGSYSKAKKVRVR